MIEYVVEFRSLEDPVKIKGYLHGDGMFVKEFERAHFFVCRVKAECYSERWKDFYNINIIEAKNPFKGRFDD